MIYLNLHAAPTPLHALEVPSRVIVVHLAFYDFLCQLSLPLSCLLRVLQLQPMLVHGEPHSLRVEID